MIFFGENFGLNRKYRAVVLATAMTLLQQKKPSKVLYFLWDGWSAVYLDKEDIETQTTS